MIEARLSSKFLFPFLTRGAKPPLPHLSISLLCLKSLDDRRQGLFPSVWHRRFPFFLNSRVLPFKFFPAVLCPPSERDPPQTTAISSFPFFPAGFFLVLAPAQPPLLKAVFPYEENYFFFPPFILVFPYDTEDSSSNKKSNSFSITETENG